MRRSSAPPCRPSSPILAGWSFYSWVFSIYMLTSALTTPLFGKLSDLYSQRRLMLIGIAIFVFGSTLCGLAPSMEALVLFRAIQGLGGGAIYALSFIVVGILYSPAQRAKMQSLISGVWGVASILGPLCRWHHRRILELALGVFRQLTDHCGRNCANRRRSQRNRPRAPRAQTRHGRHSDFDVGADGIVLRAFPRQPFAPDPRSRANHYDRRRLRLVGGFLFYRAPRRRTDRAARFISLKTLQNLRCPWPHWHPWESSAPSVICHSIFRASSG